MQNSVWEADPPFPVSALPFDVCTWGFSVTPCARCATGPPADWGLGGGRCPPGPTLLACQHAALIAGIQVVRPTVSTLSPTGLSCDTRLDGEARTLIIIRKKSPA